MNTVPNVVNVSCLEKKHFVLDTQNLETGKLKNFLEL